jgi:hypothetical protein
MSLKRYDAAQVTLILANVPIDSGFNEGEFLTIEQSAPDYEVVVGTDGEVGRSRTNNRHAVIKVKLMQTSGGNTLLSALLNLGILARNGSDVGALMVRDRISGLCTYTAAECWISKPPDVSLDNKITPREWTLECAQLIRVDAGS